MYLEVTELNSSYNSQENSWKLQVMLYVASQRKLICTKKCCTAQKKAREPSIISVCMLITLCNFPFCVILLQHMTVLGFYQIVCQQNDVCYLDNLLFSSQLKGTL